MQVTNSETLTETPSVSTVFVTIDGYEFRIWWNPSAAYWQVDAKEFDGTWSYYSSKYNLTNAFDAIRVVMDL